MRAARPRSRTGRASRSRPRSRASAARPARTDPTGVLTRRSSRRGDVGFIVGEPGEDGLLETRVRPAVSVKDNALSRARGAAPREGVRRDDRRGRSSCSLPPSFERRARRAGDSHFLSSAREPGAPPRRLGAREVARSPASTTAREEPPPGRARRAAPRRAQGRARDVRRRVRRAHARGGGIRRGARGGCCFYTTPTPVGGASIPVGSRCKNGVCDRHRLGSRGVALGRRHRRARRRQRQRRGRARAQARVLRRRARDTAGASRKQSSKKKTTLRSRARLLRRVLLARSSSVA